MRRKQPGILPFQIEASESNETVTAHTGLALVLETMRALGLGEALKKMRGIRKRRAGSSAQRNVESAVLLLAAGGQCMDDLKVLRADGALRRLLGGFQFVLPDAFRRFLYLFHDQGKIEAAKKKAAEADQKAYIPQENEALEDLARVNTALVRAVAAHGKGRRATLDHDATVIHSHKVEALWHYKKERGFQPSTVYWAEQDLAVADEFRDGNVPAGMDNLALIKKAFGCLPETIREFRFRADTACYDQRVLKWLANPQREGGPRGEIEFTISADMSAQLRAVCERVVEQKWTEVEDRVDEAVSCADVEFTPGDWPKDAKPMRYVAVRIRKKQGELFAEGGDTKFLAIVSNRRELSACELLRWHWKKAGTIEHLHDVTKNELGAGTLPCGRFGANAAWYRLSLITYNVISAMKSLALPSRFSSSRPKRLRFAVFAIAGRLVWHARKLVVRIGKEAEQLAGLIEARARLAGLGAAPAPG